MIILGVSRLQSSLIDWHVSLALRAMFEAISLTWVPCLEHVLVGMWPNCLKYSIIKTSNDHGRPSLPPLSSLGGLRGGPHTGWPARIWARDQALGLNRHRTGGAEMEGEPDCQTLSESVPCRKFTFFSCLRCFPTGAQYQSFGWGAGQSGWEYGIGDEVHPRLRTLRSASPCLWVGMGSGRP